MLAYSRLASVLFVGMIVSGLALFCGFGQVFADEAGEKELRKVASAIVSLEVFQADCRVSLSGPGIDDKPNIPRSGNLLVSSDGKGNRKLSLLVPIPEGTFNACLATVSDVIYFYVKGAEKKELAYFFDPADKESAKKNPMISGFAGVAKGTSAMDKEKKIDEFMKKLVAKGADVKILTPGHILVTNPKKDKNAFNLYYDQTTNLPGKISIFHADKNVHIQLRCDQWLRSGAVDTKLPVAVARYKPFAMNNVSEIMAAAPKPSVLLSNKPVAGAHSAKPITPMASLSHVSPPASVPAGMVAVPKAEYQEMKETITELKSTLKVLQDPDFQRSLREASSKIEKLEAQLKMLEK